MTVATVTKSYAASPIKRRLRRTKTEMQAIREAIVAEIESYHPQTVRQVFYQMTVQGIVPKVDTTKGYGTVQRLLVELRMRGEIPFSSIADNTRWMRKPEPHQPRPSYGHLFPNPEDDQAKMAAGEIALTR